MFSSFVDPYSLRILLFSLSTDGEAICRRVRFRKSVNKMQF